MRLLTFEKKRVPVDAYIFQRVLNSFLPVALAFIMGYYRLYWLMVVVIGLIIFEYAYVENRFIVKY